MRFIAYQARRAHQALATAGAAAPGPAMTVLSVMIVWIAAIVRGIAAGYVVVQVLIWHAFYTGNPWTLWGPAVAVAWGCGAIAYLRHYPPRWPVVCADTAVYMALGAGAGWCVPLAIRGEAGSWLFIVVASQLVMPIWFTPRRLGLSLALTTVAAFWAGTMLAQMGEHATRSARAASMALTSPSTLLRQIGVWSVSQNRGSTTL